MHSRRRKWLTVLITSTTLALAAAPAATAEGRSHGGHSRGPGPDAVLAWNAIAGQAALDACLAPTNNPLHESRLYAVTHIAVHDALNAIDRRSAPYAFSPRHQVRGASPEAAVATAAHDVLVRLIAELPAPFSDCAAASIAGVKTAYNDALGQIRNGKAEKSGVRLGHKAAAAVIALRADDGSSTELFDATAPSGVTPGVYRRTPLCEPPAPASCTTPFPFQFAPGWADVTPFVLSDSAQFRGGPPHPITSASYAADFNEVKRLGSDASTDRTADQTQIARFWYESSPLQWNRIARIVSAATQGLTMWDNARLFGLLNMAMADGYIGSWDTKRAYNTWRPITAIRAADTDGNPGTTVDPTWTPLMTTPPLPSYDSGHAVEGAAAAEVMRRFFGTDHRRFTTCSLTLPAGETCADGAGAVNRTFTSFSEAAEENGLSRILVGIHFRQDVDAGLEHGTRIGDRAVDRLMRPGH